MKLPFANLQSCLLLSSTALLLLSGTGIAHAENSYSRTAPKTIDIEKYTLKEIQFEGGSNHRRSSWYRMDRINYAAVRHGSGFPGGPWNSPLPPNATFSTENTARLYKGTVTNPQSALNGNLATTGIYTGMTETPFMVRDTSPIADLNTIVFQAYALTGADAFPKSWEDVYGQDGDFSALPTLKLQLSGSSEWITVDNAYRYAELYQSKQMPFDHIPVEDMDEDTQIMVYENYRLFSWDLSAVPTLNLSALTISAFAIEFELFAHVTLRSIALDQSSGFLAIPEPAHLVAILSLALLVIATLRRRTKHIN